jgi:methylenetetrahydrofolate dehydrogenase (NADP+) / methenyltetrahydrofolate cyclohydrolase
MIIDGRQIAKKIYIELKSEVEKLNQKPCLAIILVWENSPSLRYIKQKRKWAEFIGYDFQLFEYPLDVSENTILEKIQALNNDSHIHGVMIQTPLPPYIHAQKIIDTIDPNKDIDGFHAINQWKIVLWDHSWLPACTPAGIIEILKHENIDLVWKYVVIVGRSNIVGKPLANMCINAWATVTVCNSKTPQIETFTQSADIVVMAAGSPKLLKKDMIDEKTIVIDVGFSVVDGEILGDADFKNIHEHNTITPNPGWVGPMTVAFLMKNVLKAYNIQVWKI